MQIRTYRFVNSEKVLIKLFINRSPKRLSKMFKIILEIIWKLIFGTFFHFLIDKYFLFKLCQWILACGVMFDLTFPSNYYFLFLLVFHFSFFKGGRKRCQYGLPIITGTKLSLMRKSYLPLLRKQKEFSKS